MSEMQSQDVSLYVKQHAPLLLAHKGVLLPLCVCVCVCVRYKGFLLE